jgi:hypothetical protein
MDKTAISEDEEELDDDDIDDDDGRPLPALRPPCRFPRLIEPDEGIFPCPMISYPLPLLVVL